MEEFPNIVPSITCDTPLVSRMPPLLTPISPSLPSSGSSTTKIMPTMASMPTMTTMPVNADVFDNRGSIGSLGGKTGDLEIQESVPQCASDKNETQITGDHNWDAYIRSCQTNMAPAYYFLAKNSTCDVPGLDPGMKLEAIDRGNPQAFCVATVVQVVGHRVCVRYDGFGKESSRDFWCNYQAEDLYPIGWCAQNNFPLQPPHGIQCTLEEWRLFLTQTLSGALAAPRELFRKEHFRPRVHSYKVGMKIEVIHPKKPSVICPASVVKVLSPHYFMVTTDHIAELPTATFCCQVDQPGLFPPGWAAKNGIELTLPTNSKKPFSWEKYMVDCQASFPPSQLFKQHQKPRAHKFKAGFKLEAVDLEQPNIIRVGTVTNVVGRILQLQFDGQSRYQYVDCDSPLLYPIGWCKRTGHPLHTNFGKMPSRFERCEFHESKLKLTSFSEVIHGKSSAGNINQPKEPNQSDTVTPKAENPQSFSPTKSTSVAAVPPSEIRKEPPTSPLPPSPPSSCSPPDKRDGVVKMEAIKEEDDDDKYRSSPSEDEGDNDFSDDDDEHNTPGSERFYHNKNQIFFNKHCCCGPLLKRDQVMLLPDCTEPGKVSAVIKTTLEKVVKCAKDPGKVIDLMQDGSGVKFMLKHKGKTFKKVISRVDSRPKLERYLKKFCRRLVCCEHFLSLTAVSNPCPDKCQTDECGNLRGPKGVKAKRSREYFETKHLGAGKRKRGRKSKSNPGTNDVIAQQGAIGIVTSVFHKGDDIPLTNLDEPFTILDEDSDQEMTEQNDEDLLVIDEQLPPMDHQKESSRATTNPQSTIHNPDTTPVDPGFRSSPNISINPPNPERPPLTSELKASDVSSSIKTKIHSSNPVISSTNPQTPSSKTRIPCDSQVTLSSNNISTPNPKISPTDPKVSPASTMIPLSNPKMSPSNTNVPVLTPNIPLSTPSRPPPPPSGKQQPATMVTSVTNAAFGKICNILPTGSVAAKTNNTIMSHFVCTPVNTLPIPLRPKAHLVQSKAVNVSISQIPVSAVKFAISTSKNQLLPLTETNLTSSGKPVFRLAQPNQLASLGNANNLQQSFAPRFLAVRQPPGNNYRLQAIPARISQNNAATVMTVVNTTTPSNKTGPPPLISSGSLDGTASSGQTTSQKTTHSSIRPKMNDGYDKKVLTAAPNVCVTELGTFVTTPMKGGIHANTADPNQKPVVGQSADANVLMNRMFSVVKNGSESDVKTSTQSTATKTKESKPRVQPPVSKSKDIKTHTQTTRSSPPVQKPVNKFSLSVGGGMGAVTTAVRAGLRANKGYSSNGMDSSISEKSITKDGGFTLTIDDSYMEQHACNDEGTGDAWWKRKQRALQNKENNGDNRGVPRIPEDNKGQDAADSDDSLKCEESMERFLLNEKIEKCRPEKRKLITTEYNGESSKRIKTSSSNVSSKYASYKPGKSTLTSNKKNDRIKNVVPHAVQSSQHPSVKLHSPVKQTHSHGNFQSSSSFKKARFVSSYGSSSKKIIKRPVRSSSIGINTSLPGCSSQACPFHPGDPREWSMEQVAEYIQETDCKNYATMFLDQEVDGESLLLLCRNSLMQFTNMKLGPTLKLSNYIAQLRARSRR